MPRRLAAAAAIAAAIPLAGCAKPPPVVDMQILRCPTEAVAGPACEKPPAPGTERDQADVFANELGCWRRVLAWELAWEPCGK